MRFHPGYLALIYSTTSEQYSAANVLRARTISTGEINQHEGSFLVGTLLKEMYVDSALRKANKLEQEKVCKDEIKTASITISWKQFKEINKK